MKKLDTTLVLKSLTGEEISESTVPGNLAPLVVGAMKEQGVDDEMCVKVLQSLLEQRKPMRLQDVLFTYTNKANYIESLTAADHKLLFAAMSAIGSSLDTPTQLTDEAFKVVEKLVNHWPLRRDLSKHPKEFPIPDFTISQQVQEMIAAVAATPTTVTE